LHARTIALEEWRGELFFQIVNLAAQRRLRHVQPPRGTCQVEFLRHRHEVPQMPQFHAGIIPERHDRTKKQGIGRTPRSWVTTEAVMEMNATRTQTSGPAALEAGFIAAPALPTATRASSPESRAIRAPNRKRQAAYGFALAIVALVLGSVGGWWWNHSHTWVATNNAYIAGHIHTVSSRIAGNVTQVLVSDNQWVNAGEVLARLDPSDLKVAREKAQATLAQARAQLAQISAQVVRDQTIASKAESDFDRANKLFHDTSAALSKQEYDNAQAALDVARASLNATKASVLAAEALVKAASAQLADAQLQLRYTEITAPAAGRVGRKNLEVGNRVQPGQPLLAIVQPEVWITANFKETEVARLRPGQWVNVSVDGLPGQRLRGRVESISPASGAQFALLPPDNATGNFTKIVQRVPVKIVFEKATSPELAGRIVPGMSVNVKVNIRS
jgi:membrane fusion protein (multidrug efflux system)